MKTIIAVLAVLFVLLQYKLWFGEGSMMEVWQLDRAIATQTAENAQLRERNQALAARELGMIKKGETFFQVVE